MQNGRQVKKIVWSNRTKSSVEICEEGPRNTINANEIGAKYTINEHNKPFSERNKWKNGNQTAYRELVNNIDRRTNLVRRKKIENGTCFCLFKSIVSNENLHRCCFRFVFRFAPFFHSFVCLFVHYFVFALGISYFYSACMFVCEFVLHSTLAIEPWWLVGVKWARYMQNLDIRFFFAWNTICSLLLSFLACALFFFSLQWISNIWLSFKQHGLI